ncbi:PBSX family phage terminase large subunit [Saccharibacter sp. EH611]|uniref:PBSX family phage terminase large subunit n=1 Tax=Saccharibacter sp. EH611 TaxID=2689391 RepID=UPI0013237735|nr:PBSX family phage terminase large subunit [Saccharibacter sp. EH611]MXV36844.1 PBSX family phage terminase large subunit [Saccharibacter sp. EH611]
MTPPKSLPTAPTLIEVPPAFGDFGQSYRYRLWYGGRGSGKSWTIARVLIALAVTRPVRVLCCREYQTSIAESVHKLLVDQITALGLNAWFVIHDQHIRATNGSEFIFKGLARHSQSIKSTEGIDIAWVEEAQTISQESLDILLPTIRKNSSELWFSWNPLERDAPIEQLRESLYGHDNALIQRVNWSDNPWFPDTLNQERLRCYQHAPNLYPHIWEGDYRQIGQAFFTLDDLLHNDTPIDVPAPVDGVFAVMDTSLKGGIGNDGTAVIYFALNRFDRAHPLTVLDWELVELEAATLENWTPRVLTTLEDWARKPRARHGVIACFIEDRAAGSVILPQLKRQGLNVQAIDAALTARGKDQRALEAGRFTCQGHVRLARPAFDRVSLFRGQSRNHFLTQTTNFHLSDPHAARRSDDLLDCFCYGIILGLSEL